MTKQALAKLKRARASYIAMLEERDNVQVVLSEAKTRLDALQEELLDLSQTVEAGKEELRKDFQVLDVDFNDDWVFYLNNLDTDNITLDVTGTTILMGSMKLVKALEKELKLFKKYAAVLGCD